MEDDANGALRAPSPPQHADQRPPAVREGFALQENWNGRAVGLLDLDAFFASVEQLDHPEWRGKPVIVGGDAERRGVVSTASYEARAFGVHSAMPSVQARHLCPDAIWVSPRIDRYREVSACVMECIERETPYVEPVSIDEAFFDVTPGRFSHDDPVEICRRIAACVEQLGVTCSMGISTSKTVSKIASERNKPNGLTVVYPGTEAAFLAPLSVHAMSGIGPQTQHRLERLGIKTLGDLAHANPAVLESALGVLGPRLIERAAGHDAASVARIDEPDAPKSISSERTFAHDLVTYDTIATAIRYIASLTARRLRSKGYKGRTVTLKCCYRVGETRTVRTTLATRTDDEHDLAETALSLLGQVWGEGTHIRLLGIAVSNWDARPEQLGLFDEPAGNQRRAAQGELGKTADRLRKRFGESAVMYGSELKMRDQISKTPSGTLAED